MRLLNSKRLTMTLLAASAVLALQPLRAQQTQQTKPAQPAQQPPKPPTESNPFPEDTNNVPVMPNATTAAPATAPAPSTAPRPALPSDENDPVRSPDDPLPDLGTNSGGSSSSNSPDLQKLLQPPPDEGKGKHAGTPAPEHTETAKEDESVGNLYMGDHDWKGALSRFESALILDPENPDVYWGLAECQRHLGQLAAAKANYLKVMEYDPDSRHAKDAKKILKDPEMASVK